MNGFWKDLAFGVRTQLKTPAVTLALIVTQPAVPARRGALRSTALTGQCVT
jgi:hypothetical protein